RRQEEEEIWQEEGTSIANAQVRQDQSDNTAQCCCCLEAVEDIKALVIVKLLLVQGIIHWRSSLGDACLL
ncbi:hypothetical protein Q6247_27050, partial [Klebsiella pneumoniae]